MYPTLPGARQAAIFRALFAREFRATPSDVT
jgi:hypothetical protein